jgi:hypothetical protein
LGRLPILPFDDSLLASTLNTIDFSSGTWQTDANKTQLITPATSPVAATDPQGKFGTNKSWKVTYPTGSYSPSGGGPVGGDQWKAPFTLASKTALGLDYWVYFPVGFDFVKGGKLPGLYSGNPSNASGGTQTADAMTTRLMWRTGGAGELYLYSPNRSWYPNGGSDGLSVGRGQFTFVPGKWHHIRQYVQLNVSGENDRIRVWFDDMLKPAIDLGGVNLETSSALTLDGLYFSTFFGGDDAPWASPSDQNAYFSGFVIWE